MPAERRSRRPVPAALPVAAPASRGAAPRAPAPAPTVAAILEELRGLATESCKRTLLRHGAREPIFGVKIGSMQPIRMRIGIDHPLALGLWKTRNADARYLAGLIADPRAMTPRQLDGWARQADWSLMVCAVAGVAAESPHGWDLAWQWIDAERPGVAECGWATLANIVSITPDADLDLPRCRTLLDRIVATLPDQPDRVRYAMNGFVIALGSFVRDLTPACLAAADRIGPVEVDMGPTECQVPDARTYIEKVRTRGTLGKKRKSARC